MKLLKWLLPALLVVTITSGLQAQVVENNRREQDGGNLERGISERDFVALSEYMASKRNVDLKDKVNNLKISGDVRFEWRHLNESGIEPITTVDFGNFSQNNFLENGQYQTLRGHNRVDPYTIKKVLPRGLPLSRNDFDVEFNLSFKYEIDRSYAVAQLGFDNACGVSDNGWWDFDEDPAGFHGSGTGDKISLKRAYWGYAVYEGKGIRFDVELGRHKLYDIFESEIMYSSRADGLVLYLSGENDRIGEWYWTAAGWVVDERVNHLAYGTEVGILNFMNQGLDLKYSFVNWNKYGQNRFFVRNPNGMRFQVNQFLATYHLNPEWFCGKPAEVYGAVVYNSDPRHYANRVVPANIEGTAFRKLDEPDHRKFNRERWAWYAGFLIGKVRKEGDWSVEVQYQYAEAYAFPDNDENGLGRGNCLDESMTYQFRGNTNYKGLRIQGLYALTDQLTLDSKLEFTRAVNKKLGGKHHYSCFEIEMIYAF